MKKQAYTMIAMLVLVGSMAVAAQAQTSGRMQLLANIPFQFSVDNKSLPAGDYKVRQVNLASDHIVLQLRSKDGSASAMIQMNCVTGKAQKSAKLIFNRYGNHYYFAEAWTEGDSTGLRAPKSRGERAAEREFAALNMATEAIAVAARR